MRTHQEIDERSLALASAIAEKIDSDPGRGGLDHARQVCERWSRQKVATDVQTWQGILTRDWPEIRPQLLEDSERGRRLRQSSPFCGILTPRERWAIYRRFRDRDESPA